MNSPLVSVITVSYNSLAGLKATNASLRICVQLGWETILIDGLSTDGTSDFLASPDCNYSFCLSEKDAGIYDAMNKGIARAQGRYVLFMNTGDRFHEAVDFDRLAKDLSKTDTIAIGHCLTDAGHLVQVNSDMFRPWTFARMAFPHQASFIPKSEFIRLGPYDVRFRLAADQEWFLRAMRKKATFTSLGQIIARYEGGGLSESLALRALANKERRIYLVRHMGWLWYLVMQFIRRFEFDELLYKALRRLRRLF